MDRVEIKHLSRLTEAQVEHSGWTSITPTGGSGKNNNLINLD
jgi:hypothetical protein